MKQKIICSIIFIFTLTFASQSQSATLTVRTESDGLNTGNCSLREAVINASIGSEDYSGCNIVGDIANDTEHTIVLTSGGNYTLSLTGTDDVGKSGDLDFATNLTIQTDGSSRATIDMSSLPNERVFHSVGSNADLTLENLLIKSISITSGTTLQGGVIYQNTGDLTLTNVVFQDHYIELTNADLLQGGLVYFDGNNSSNLSISHCEFNYNNIHIFNTSTSNSGITQGAHIYSTQVTSVNISNTGFEANDSETAIQFLGGSVYIEGGTVEISDSDFDGFASTTDSSLANAPSYGGFIYLKNLDSLTVSQSSFCGGEHSWNSTNTSISKGGAFFIENTSSSPYNVSFINNSICSNSITDSYDSYGGGLFFSGPLTVNLAFNTIFGNEVSSSLPEGGAGAGIAFEDTSGTSTYTLKSNIIANNHDFNTNYDDCYTANNSTLTSLGYNFISNLNACTLSSNTNDITNASLTTYDQGSYGGNNTFLIELDTMSQFAISDCLLIDGTQLTEDQRGAPRDPLSTGTCYSGAFEALTYYEDLDGDGYALDTTTGSYHYTDSDTTQQGDCNDDPTNDGENFNPGVVEVCDYQDNDCDGTDDNGVLTTYYPDADQDGYYDDSLPTVQDCTAPEGNYTTNASIDCDDNDANQHHSESCSDGVDNDCDDLIDDADPDCQEDTDENNDNNNNNNDENDNDDNDNNSGNGGSGNDGSENPASTSGGGCQLQPNHSNALSASLWLSLVFTMSLIRVKKKLLKVKS